MNLTNFGHFNRGYLPDVRLDAAALRSMRRGAIRTARIARKVLFRPYLLTILALIVVEAALGLRVWTQISGEQSQSWWLSPLTSLSGPLVAPFSEFDHEAPLTNTAVFEISTVVAMNVYLIIALVGMLTGIVLSGIVGLIASALRPHYDDEPKELTVYRET